LILCDRFDATVTGTYVDLQKAFDKLIIRFYSKIF